MKNSRLRRVQIKSSFFRTLIAFFVCGCFHFSFVHAIKMENEGFYFKSVEQSKFNSHYSSSINLLKFANHAWVTSSTTYPKPQNSIKPIVSNQPSPSFIPNKGQFAPEVISRLPLTMGDVWLTKSGIWITLFPENQMEKLHERVDLLDTLKGCAIHIEMKNAQFNEPQYFGDESQEYYNYFKGKNSKNWKSQVRKQSIVYFNNVYPGIDMQFYLINNQIKYNWIIHPGANSNAIQVVYHGLKNISKISTEENSIDSKLTTNATVPGLILNSGILDIQESIPSSYLVTVSEFENTGLISPEYLRTQIFENQMSSKNDYLIDSNKIEYRIDSNLISRFQKGDSFVLVIDPVLVFSTFSGSVADNFGCTGTYDEHGNAYAGGTVFDFGLPTTSGAYQVSFSGGEEEELGYGGSRDVAILKFSPNGNKLLFCTYLGGNSNEQPHSMVVDSLFNLFVMGTTRSLDFPVSENCYDAFHNDKYDFFVTALDSNGTQLLGSTFVGGSEFDGVGADRSVRPVDEFPLLYNYADEFRGEIIVDQNYVYIGGVSYSRNFPVTSGNTNSSDKSLNGVVFCLNKNMSQLIWSTQITSNDLDFDAIYGVALGKNGDIYATGGTNSKGLKQQFGSQWLNNMTGDVDGILVRLNKNNGNLISGRYFGTTAYEQSYFVQSDNSGRPYIYGQTEGVINPINSRYADLNTGQFIARFSTDLANIELQTTFGANGNMPNISPSAFLIDRCERIFISGWGGATNTALYDIFTGNSKRHRNKGNTRNLKVTNDAIQKMTDGSDFYIAVFSKNMYDLAFATYFGGLSLTNTEAEEHVDGGTSRFDRKGIIYQSLCGGCRRNGVFPTTPNAYSRTMNSNNCNNALFKIDFENLNKKPFMTDTFIQVIATQSIDFQKFAFDRDVFDTVNLEVEWMKKGGILGNDTPQIILTSGINHAKLKFNWKTICSSFSKDTAILKVRIMDCGCPQKDTTYAYIKILVTEPPVINPPEAICVSYDRITKKMKIAWPQTSPNNEFFNYYLLEKTDPQNNVKIIDTIRNSNEGFYLDDQVVNPNLQNYCYQLIGVNTCNKRVFPLNKYCTIRELNTPIESVHIIEATVFEDRKINLRWEMSKEPDFKEFEVYKHKRNSTPVYQTPVTITSDTVFSDSSVNVDLESFCYEIIVIDQCGHISKPSNKGCNVVLSGKTSKFPNAYFELNWMNYEGWRNEPEIWTLERKYGGNPNFSPIFITSNSNRYHKDDQLDYDWGGYWYRVYSREPNPISGPDFNARTESNWVYLFQPPEVWMPDAFTVNGDNLNEIWGTMPIFVRNYSLKVYNRWGQKIWETSNKKEQWNGMFNDQQVADGIYSWLLDFEGWDDNWYRKTGTVIVIH